MSKWNLSSTAQKNLNSLFKSLPQNSSISEGHAEEDEVIKKFWESHMKQITSSTSAKEKSNGETFGSDFLVPLMSGIWKQGFVSELVDEEDDSSDEELDTSTDETKQRTPVEPVDVTQEDTFLADLSQMLK